MAGEKDISERLRETIALWKERGFIACWNGSAAYDLASAEGYYSATQFTAALLSAADTKLSALDAENARQAAEIASLRASLGEATGAEPIGCPCPGACSATALQSRALAAEEERDRLRKALEPFARFAEVASTMVGSIVMWGKRRKRYELKAADFDLAREALGVAGVQRMGARRSVRSGWRRRRRADHRLDRPLRPRPDG